MNIRKMLALLATLLLVLAPALGAAAEGSANPFAVAGDATPLPFDLSFAMDFAAVEKALGEDVDAEDWGDGTGLLLKNDVALGNVELTAEIASFQVDTNNSDKASRLSMIGIELSVSDNCIAAFRAALAAISAAYGEPDGDPFDEYGVESYVEYGNLSATWTKPDVRINLSMSRMYNEMLSLDFTNRLCYDPEDLK